MFIITLLNLPMELPPDSPACIVGDEILLTNLENWLKRVGPTKAAWLAHPTMRHTAHTRFTV